MRALALTVGTAASGALVWPTGRLNGVPETTMLDERPW